MWRKAICSGRKADRSTRTHRSLLIPVGVVAMAIATVPDCVAQERPTSDDSLVESEAAVEGQPERISDWALAGVVWSDAHLVRQLAQREASLAEDPQRVEIMKALVEDSGQIIEILQDFGWRSLDARRAELAANAENTEVGETAPDQPNLALERDAVQPSPASPPPSLSRRVETESPPGLNDPGVDDELISPDVDFDLNRYRVDDYIDEVPAERRSLADAVEDGVEAALAAGIDNISGTYGVGRGAGRISQREVMTRSNTLPYSKDSIYDTDDFDPDVDYDVNKPLTEPVPSDTNPLIERVEDEDLENRPVESPGAVPSDAPDVEGEDDLIGELAREGAVPADDEPRLERLDGELPDGRRAERRRATPDDFPIGTTSSDSDSGPDVDPTDLRRFTDKREQFAQDAAWVQFQFDANQRTWQLVQAEADETSVRRYLDAAVAQLQAHAQVGAGLTRSERLGAILRVIGGNE